MIATGFFCIDSTLTKPVRKLFLVKEQFVKLPAQLELISLCEHHEREDIRHGEYVNRFLFIIFRIGKQDDHFNHI
jgi:hypothetical protein